MYTNEEKDPDTLQLRDEMNTKWVEAWRTAILGKKIVANNLTLEVIPTERTVYTQKKRAHLHKTQKQSL